LAGSYAADFAALGVFLQFLPAWLSEVQGFGKAEIAVIFSAQTLARTLVGPLWCQWLDRYGDARRLLTVMAAGSLAVCALFAWALSVTSAWFVAFAFGCLYPPMHAVLDATAVRESELHGYSFGRLRAVGSAAFLVAILAVGAWVEHQDAVDDVYVILLVLLAATTWAARWAPRGRWPAPASPGRPAAWWRLLGSGPVVGVLLCSALIQGSHATYYQLSTVHWSEHGVSKSVSAALWAEGVLAEVLLLCCARRVLDQLRPTTLLLLGGGGAVVRWLVVGATTSVPVLFAVNWLHALSFAATYVGAIRAVERRVPPAQRATAQGVLGAATSGVGMVLCGLCGGCAFEVFGARAYYLMAAFAAGGVVVALWLRRAPGAEPLR
jgi:PPP family 3-phenylpropionic acid transporter